MGKVTWPPRPELIQATTVVIVAVAIAAVYIGLLDLVWSSLVNFVRLS
jgi:preprotein translocase SecE subunit